MAWARSIAAAGALAGAGALVRAQAARAERRHPPAGRLLLREAFRALGIHRPIVLGHSWGTQVAIALALAEPGVPRSLVLASGLYFPSVRLDAPFLVPPAVPLAGSLLRHTLSPLAGRAMWPLWLRILFWPAPVPPSFHALAWKALRPETLRAVAEEALMLLPVTLAAMARYREVTLPVALVTGARDMYVGARAHTARLKPMLLNAELLVAPAAGHMVHHADSPMVLRAIERASWGSS